MMTKMTTMTVITMTQIKFSTKDNDRKMIMVMITTIKINV